MIDFLEESKNFAGVTFSGFFTMSTNTLRKLHNHYLDTGENLLDDFCRITYEKWDLSRYKDPFHQYMIDHEELNRIRVSVSNMRRVGLYDPDTLREIEYHAKNRYKKWQDYQERQLSDERKEACRFTSRSEVRSEIFELHGGTCLSCGSDEDIALDHIIPVARGGENEIDNLQPLCKSCNSSKGTQIIDYREGSDG